MSEQKPDPWAAVRVALDDARAQMTAAVSKAAVAVKAQTALRCLLDGNEQAARQALAGLSSDEAWAVSSAAHTLTNLACDVFADAIEKQQGREGRKS
ncbi:hypothetical protein ACVDFE_02200 [Lentzea chajnantorensis]